MDCTKYIILQRSPIDQKGDKCREIAEGDHLVQYNFKTPKDAVKYLQVPYVPNGFQNSCSECGAEMILRYWKVKGWSQYEIHKFGYQTFEGGIAEGDFGILPLFRFEHFCTTEGEPIGFTAEIEENKTIDDLIDYINQGFPIIVRIETNSRGDRHTIVLIGYTKKGFYFHDNDRGSNQFVSFNNFNDQWRKALLIVKKR